VGQARAARSVGGQVIPLVGRERELDLLMSLREECVRERVARAGTGDRRAGTRKKRAWRVSSFLSRGSYREHCSLHGNAGSAEARFLAAGLLAGRCRHPDRGTRGGRNQAGIRTVAARKGSAGAPVVVLEDLQWADAASVQVMDEVLGLFSDQPLLVLPWVGRGGGALPRLVGRTHGRVHPPGTFATQGRQNLLRLRTPPLTAEAEHFVLERWEGNPMFLEEMADAIAVGRRSAGRGAGRGRSAFRLPVPRGTAGVARGEPVW